MRSELPVFKRCCFCFPLRYGLIVWGFVKLSTSCLTITTVCFMLRAAILYGTGQAKRSIPIPVIVMGSIAGIVGVADFGLTIAYIVGCYKKNVKLLRIYYFYSTFLVTITILFDLYCFADTSYFLFRFSYDPMFLRLVVYEIMEALVLFSNVVIQVYMILLVKSEITKLENGSQFRFVNHAAGPQCNLTIDSTKTDQVTEKENAAEDKDTKVTIDVY